MEKLDEKNGRDGRDPDSDGVIPDEDGDEGRVEMLVEPHDERRGFFPIFCLDLEFVFVQTREGGFRGAEEGATNKT